MRYGVDRTNSCAAILPSLKKESLAEDPPEVSEQTRRDVRSDAYGRRQRVRLSDDRAGIATLRVANR